MRRQSLNQMPSPSTKHSTPESRLYDCERLDPIPLADAHALGLDVRPQNSDGEFAWIHAAELWMQSRLSEDWTAAYRLMIRDGRPVVAELRVFPYEPQQRRVGEWNGIWLGAHATVPNGGVSMRLLRQIRVGHSVRSVASIVDYLRQKYAEPDLQETLKIFGLLDVVSAAPPASATTPQRRGRPRLADREYARIAAAYVAAIKRGSRRPIAEIAKQFRISASSVRSRIHTARGRRFLEPGTQGTAGGQLTAEAVRLLKGRHR